MKLFCRLVIFSLSCQDGSLPLFRVRLALCSLAVCRQYAIRSACNIRITYFVLLMFLLFMAMIRKSVFSRHRF